MGGELTRSGQQVIYSVLGKVVSTLAVLLGVSILTFLLSAFSPGDPAYLILSAEGNVEPTPLEISEMRQELGLDQPLYRQYLHWAGQVIQGNLSRSFVTGEPIAQEITRRLPVTLKLASLSLLLAITAGVGLGFLGAAFPNRYPDRASQLTGVALISMPDFWLAILLIGIFAEWLGILPTSGVETSRSFILPAIVLAAATGGSLFRLCRTLLLTEMNRPYIATAQSKGLHDGNILFKHAFRNILAPLLTAIGISFGHMLGGAVIIESIFAIPGLGQFGMNGISNRDYPVIQAYVLYSAFLFVTVNVLLDMAYLVINPQMDDRSK